MQYFEYAHLPEKLQEISKPIGELASDGCIVAGFAGEICGAAQTSGGQGLLGQGAAVTSSVCIKLRENGPWLRKVLRRMPHSLSTIETGQRLLAWSRLYVGSGERTSQSRNSARKSDGRMVKDLGECIETLENLNGALQLPMPADFHVERFIAALPELMPSSRLHM